MSRWRSRKRWMKRYFNKIVRHCKNLGDGHGYRRVFSIWVEHGNYIFWMKHNKYQRGDSDIGIEEEEEE